MGIQRDILYAMKKIGGPQAKQLALKLVEKDKSLTQYAQKLYKTAM